MNKKKLRDKNAVATYRQKTDEKHKAYQLLVAGGITSTNASKLLKYHEKTGYQLNKFIKKGIISPISEMAELHQGAVRRLTNSVQMRPKRVKIKCPGCKGSGKLNIGKDDEITCSSCNGERYITGIKYPSFSDAHSAATEVLARTDPKIHKSQTASVEITCDVAQLDDYK